MSALVRNTLISTLFLVVGVLAGDLGKRDAEKARQAWMAGYLKIESAAKAVEEQKFMFALELYEEALATFQEVGVRYPEWNPDVVSFRINYCTEKVRELREAVEIAAEKMSRPDLIRTVNHLRRQRDSFESVKDRLQADLKVAQERAAETAAAGGRAGRGAGRERAAAQRERGPGRAEGSARKPDWRHEPGRGVRPRGQRCRPGGRAEQAGRGGVGGGGGGRPQAVPGRQGHRDRGAERPHRRTRREAGQGGGGAGRRARARRGLAFPDRGLAGGEGTRPSRPPPP